ncbi:MAG: glycosyltransferase [Candidatus Thermoplasmatota archaeon]|nr:glycosyltransferase [Candidatus Thermoplasmatota archaeon]
MRRWMVKLSIVVPTLNEGHYLPILLDSIKSQTYKDYEVIVSDAGSKDGTVATATKYGCVVVIDKKKGPGYGRNRGAELASGKYMLFLDSDVFFPSRHFLERFMEIVERRRIRLGSCLIEPYPARLIDRFMSPITNTLIFTSAGIAPFAMGFFIFVSSAVHKKIGGFDETILVGEDQNYVRRASKYARFKAVPSMKICYSTRRLEKEGRLTYYPKCLLMSIYQTIVGEIDKPIFEYEFGSFRPPKATYDEIMREIGEKKYVDGAILRKILEQFKSNGNGRRNKRKRKAKSVFGKRKVKKPKNKSRKSKRKIK